MIRINLSLLRIPRLTLVCSLLFCMMIFTPECLAAENPDKPDFWVRNDVGAITHTWTGNDPDQSLVMNMQGLKVVMQFQSSFTKGLSYTSRFFNVKTDNFNKIMIDSGTESDPELRFNNLILKIGSPVTVTFDGMLTFTYPENKGIRISRTIYPSNTNALVIEEWLIQNQSDKKVKMSVSATRQVQYTDEEIVVVRTCTGTVPVSVEPGNTLSFTVSIQSRVISAPDLLPDIAKEHQARVDLAKWAWQGPGRLETPDPALDLAYALQKFHILECPAETWKGIITHNGSLRYSPGIWANDPVEYSSPVFPFFGNDQLNNASLNMYRIWMDYCRENGIRPFPGSFEHAALKLVQQERGDDAMVLCGLSKFLLFLGDPKAAAEMWPLIEFSAQSVQGHLTKDGIIASETDEMEGRYPTGDANLSTSSLAYAGYRQAANLARDLGKKSVEIDFNKRADALRKAIEAYFGAEIDGFKTYRYFKENTTLRGWILLPIAMGISDRQEGTIAALLSDKLWPRRLEGADILAESNVPTEWARETYYALRVLFKAGRTEEALDQTRRVVKTQVFGEMGPYPDEDAIDMLCPGSLYPRVFTEGMFGIVPVGLKSFTCTPWLPREWPRMALRDLRTFGQAWDLVVERDGLNQKITISSGGKIIFTGSGPAGKTYSVKFSAQIDQPADSGLVYHWSFNKPLEKGTDTFTGNFESVKGVHGMALKFDGFTTCIERKLSNVERPDGAITVESWLALAAYPWDWSPIADCSQDELTGFFFGINREGHIGYKIAAGNSWFEVETESAFPLGKWAHVCAVFIPGEKVSIYINGEEAVYEKIKGNYIPTLYGRLTIGRNVQSKTWYERQLTTENSYFFLDGILDEVKIYDRAKTVEEIRKEFASVTNNPAPALTNRKVFPLGSVGSGSFGAFYAKLDYYKEWDDLWRVSEVPDVFVRFDESPVQLVFWRGTSFVPCWVSENGIWYTNEWLESWGSDVASCAEPLMDRFCRFSHVRIIENTDARVVIHWRYALNDAFYTILGNQENPRGEWCDEFYVIYPDQAGVRKMELHYTTPVRKHDWEEQIVLLPPGKYPQDVIDKKSVMLVNMKGETADYTWDDKIGLEMPEPRGANMSLVNLKSAFKPFIIVSPNPVETVEGKWDSPYFRTYAANMAKGYREDPAPSAYGWWNHWPVTQIPGDGRWVVTHDHPSHFNLTTFVQWEDYALTNKTRTRIMLQGMTPKGAEGLVPMAKSWLRAPKLELASSSYKGGSYDQSERAYVIEKNNLATRASVDFTIRASNESPLLNPAFIVRNWGKQEAEIRINGQDIPAGKNCRQGIVSRAEGDDLIIWLRLESEKLTKVSLIGR